MQSLPHWLEPLCPSDSLDVYRELAYTHALQAGAVGLEIIKLIKRGDFAGLCTFEVPHPDVDIWKFDGQGVEDDFARLCKSQDLVDLGRVFASTVAGRYYNAVQAIAFFSKLDFLDIGVDKEAVALKKFLEAEELCRESNHLFRCVARGTACLSPRVSAVLHGATRKIARVLGKVPAWPDLDLRFGPGATRGTQKTKASSRNKIGETLQCSENLIPLLPALLGEVPHLAEVHKTVDLSRFGVNTEGEEYVDQMVLCDVEIIHGRIAFVPKNAKTDRSICVEPGLNVLVQAAIGSHLKRRLAAFGVDISDQTLNQRMAQEGSLTGALATLDLSSASDTVSTEIVKALLPVDWALFLERTRTTVVDLPASAGQAQSIHLEKFSSMGNGFTFGLETLIFWSLASECCESGAPVSVYGDDIIVPTNAVELLQEVLSACGFIVNSGKSFVTGSFRESCGKDYYWGIDVRPFFPRGMVSGQSLFVMHNYYVRRGDTQRASLVYNLVHHSTRILGPDGFGDGHLVCESYERERPLRLTASGFEGHFFRTFVARSPRDATEHPRAEYVVPLYHIYRRGDEGEEFKWDDVTSPLRFAEQLALREQLTQQRFAGPAIPEEAGVKALALPGVCGYKKIKIYRLG